ncbi:MAG TPA: hypothetical protein VD962_09875, partial [Rubricoccaceae bacterium]|nr:hypothetical protein [Rubricoccaceae bacterium]
MTPTLPQPPTTGAARAAATADAAPLADIERAVLRRVLAAVEGAEHALAVLTGLHAQTVIRASEGGALSPRSARALRRLLHVAVDDVAPGAAASGGAADGT